ncbi:hypothetical protein AGR4A_Cc80047 [Agrobacterium tumefaciens str. B6]|uniref:Uncharacterized protein n=1 Tax=Agrobacterium tumefaciens str. B6 TaxID=1183423 RepID=A0A822V5M2_AGRTU|nr:hypothetical protein AGR4A_Cc80047 [Agrobacterium tumefaciens str. B6]
MRFPVRFPPVPTTGQNESKPEGERGEGFEKGFCADTSNRDRQEQGRRGFLMSGELSLPENDSWAGVCGRMLNRCAQVRTFQPSFL